jgi:hypothetical protein
MRLQVNFRLGTGSLTLARQTGIVEGHGGAARHMKDFLKLQFMGLLARYIKRPTSSRIDLGLGSLDLFDGSVVGSLFPALVKAQLDPGLADGYVFFFFFSLFCCWESLSNVDSVRVT